MFDQIVSLVARFLNTFIVLFHLETFFCLSADGFEDS